MALSSNPRMASRTTAPIHSYRRNSSNLNNNNRNLSRRNSLVLDLADMGLNHHNNLSVAMHLDKISTPMPVLFRCNHRLHSNNSKQHSSQCNSSQQIRSGNRACQQEQDLSPSINPISQFNVKPRSHPTTADSTYVASKCITSATDGKHKSFPSVGFCQSANRAGMADSATSDDGWTGRFGDDTGVSTARR